MEKDSKSVPISEPKRLDYGSMTASEMGKIGGSKKSEKKKKSSKENGKKGGRPRKNKGL